MEYRVLSTEYWVLGAGCWEELVGCVRVVLAVHCSTGVFEIPSTEY
jgi:hypothetical protein